MPANYVLLQRIELNADASAVEFTNIPQSGYTDLKLVMSGRSDYAGIFGLGQIRFNGDTGNNYSMRRLQGNGASAASAASTGVSSLASWDMVGNNSTANTFGSAEFYIPNYTSSNAKSISVDSVTENNATTAYTTLQAGLWSGTAAISSITVFIDSQNLLANSTFSLYGLAATGTTPVIAPKASGGNITSDGTYWIHTFTSTGTFTPLQGLSCDYLVVAGGGGGGGGLYGAGAGGGAGGLRSTVTGTGGSGSLESPISVASGTAYTITVGAGGAGGANNLKGAVGSNSVFSTITSTGGGGGAAPATSYLDGIAGGSGGGGSATAGTVGSAGSASPSGQGYAGGIGSTDGATYDAGGGGGGASAVGGNGNSTQSGNGGNGRAVAITGTSTTYGGGGAGGNYSGEVNGTGGTGGGGNGGVAGTTNTGGGGGGSAYPSQAPAGKAGGSGIVIIRYLVA